MEHSKYRKGFKIVTLVISLITASILILPKAYAINPQPEPPFKLSVPIFGMIGINFQSILRLNVLNASDLVAKRKATQQVSIDSRGGSSSAGGCSIIISFLGSDANLLKESIEETIAPGRAMQFDFTIPPDFDVIRLNVRPVIEVASSNKKQCALINANVEVADKDSRTTNVFVNPLQYILINPQPEPPFRAQ